MKPNIYSFPAPSTTAVALAQTAASGVPLVINGALLTTNSRWAPQSGLAVALLPNIARKLTLTSAGNLSAVNFVIVGTDAVNAPLTETIAGPNATTVTTVNQFHTVNSITPSGAVGTAVSVGTSAEGSTKPIRVDYLRNPTTISLDFTVTGTISGTVQYSFENPPTTWLAHPDMTAMAATTVGNVFFPPQYIRCIINSGTGSAVFTEIQAG